MSRTTLAGRKLVLLTAIGLATLACNLQLGTPVNIPADATTTEKSNQEPPTNTASPAPSLLPTDVATALPTATQGPPPVITVSAVGGRLNVRRGPGPEYDAVAAFLEGQSRTATGRDAGGAWLLISGPNSSTTLGWVIVTTKYTSVSGEVDGLPVVAVAPAAPAYIRNCTLHEMLVNPAGVVLPDRNSTPDNKLQFFPGEYSVIDLTTETEAASVTVFEGRTIDIRKDSGGSSYTCP